MCHADANLTAPQRSAYLRLREMMCAYLIERDTETMLSYFTDDVQSIGTGAQEVALGRDALRRLVESEIAQDPIPFSIAFEQVYAVSSADETCVSLYTVIAVSKQLSTGIPIHVHMRQTAQLRLIDGLFYIYTVHVSIPAAQQTEDEYYPIQFGERTLRERHDQLDNDLFVLLNETMPGGIMGGYYEPGFPLYFINDRMLSFLGYDDYAQFEAAIGGLVLNSIYPDDRSRVCETVSRDLAHQPEYTVTYRMLTRTGGLLWVHDKGRLIRTEDGRDAIISVCLDITAQVEAENELSLIAQSKIGGIFKARLTDGFPLLYANDCYYQLHGHTRETFFSHFDGQTARVVHPDDIQAVSARISQAIADKAESLTLEYRVLRGDGQTAWLHASASLTETSNGFLLSGMVINIDERKRFEEQLQRSEERFQIAIAQAHIYVWEYDLATHTIIQTDQSLRSFGMNRIIRDVPQSLIDSQAVHPDDVHKCLALYQELHSGVKTANTTLRMRDPDGNYRWRRIHYTNLFDPDGTAVRAVAVSDDVTEQKEAEQRFFQEEYLREMLSADVLISAKVNLTHATVLHVWSEHYHAADLRGIDSYDALCAEVIRCIANPGDQKRFASAFSAEALLAASHEGRQSVYSEYRCISDSGRIIWCGFHLAMMTDPDTSELMAFAYIRDINDRKKSELALRERAERDALTGLYNRQTAESLISQRLSSLHDSGRQCAFFIIDMDDFKHINDRYGHYYGDRLLAEVGRILRVNTTSGCISARLGGDEFLMFFDEIPSRHWALDTANHLCQQLGIRYTIGSDALDVSASVGIVTSDLHSADFSRMFQQADTALYDAKYHGKARFTCYGSHHPQQEHEMRLLYDGCLAKQHIGKHCMLDMLDDSIFVIDRETHDVLFMNRTAQREFGIEEYLGCKCYDILQGFSHPCIFCQSHLPEDSDGFKTWENVNARLHKSFMIRDRIIHWDGRAARLEIFTDLTRHEEQLGAKMQAEHVLLECISLLMGTRTLDGALPDVLRTLGRFYRADRAYFVRTQNSRTIHICENDWCAPGLPAFTDENLRIEQSSLAAWLDYLRTARVVVFLELEQMRALFPEKYAVLHEKGVSTFAAVALLDDDHSLMGYIGIENPRSNLDSTTMLQSLSYFLHSEITKRQIEARNVFLTQHDAMTGLLNWQSYCRAAQFIHADTLSSLGVLVTDINHLHLLNQECGCDYGDQLLCTLAQTMTDAFGAPACFRISGDSFVALCIDITYETFQHKLEQVRNTMEDAYPGCVSLGFSWADEDILPAHLMNSALERLSVIQHKHHEHYLQPDDRLRDTRLRRLKAALADGRFHVYLQPKAEIETGRIVGAEALVRYSDEVHGIVPPIKFIPQLEAENTIRYVDFFVLEQVCARLQIWAARGMELFPVSINFSRCTLMEIDVVDKITQITDRYGTDRSLIEIEITESMGVMNRRSLVEVCHQIIDAGYRLSLDDFGSEYSNISILSSLPLKGLKFDKSVINDLYSNATTRLLIENLIHVCHEMGIDSIAEGVEEQEQLDILRSFGCTYAQGYLFNKPLPIPDFERRYLDPTAQLLYETHQARRLPM